MPYSRTVAITTEDIGRTHRRHGESSARARSGPRSTPRPTLRAESYTSGGPACGRLVRWTKRDVVRTLVADRRRPADLDGARRQLPQSIAAQHGHALPRSRL